MAYKKYVPQEGSAKTFGLSKGKNEPVGTIKYWGHSYVLAVTVKSCT